MDLAKLSLPVVVLGLVLLLLSFTWGLFVRGDQVWKAEEAKSHQQAAANLHEAIHVSSGAPGHVHEGAAETVSVEAAKAQYEVSAKKLAEAQGRGRTTAWILRACGILLLTIGSAPQIAGWFKGSQN